MAENQMRMKSYQCIPFKQGGHQLAVFVIPAKELYGLVKINRREEDKKTGYQRALGPGRPSLIAKFIDSGAPLPTTIVVAFDHAKLSSDKSRIEIQEGGDAGWVIDGQHRLAGASEASKDIVVSVTAFFGLDLEGQILQFITINREAKKVPTSLYLDLLPQLKTDTKSEKDQANERAVDLANAAKIDEDSPFFNRIVSLKAPGKGQISLTNWTRKVAPLVHSATGILRTRTQKEQLAMLENYFNALSEVFPKEYAAPDSIFFKTVGFGALLNAFAAVNDITLKRTHKSFTKKDVITTLKPISDFDFNEWKGAGTGSAMELAAGGSFGDALRAVHEDAMDEGTLSV